MRLICINNKYPKMPQLLQPEHWIFEGETYTIHSAYTDKGDGLRYYYLVEKMHLVPLVSYRANRFLPLSDIDEKDVHEEALQQEAISQ